MLSLSPSFTTRSRDASRGDTGRSAMRSAGRSKSKSATRSGALLSSYRRYRGGVVLTGFVGVAGGTAPPGIGTVVTAAGGVFAGGAPSGVFAGGAPGVFAGGAPGMVTGGRAPGDAPSIPEGAGTAGTGLDGAGGGTWSAAIEARTIRDGFAGGSPFSMASTNSIPEVTRPHTVYWWSSFNAGARQI